MNTAHDHYSVLGVSATATQEMIREAFAVLMGKFPAKRDASMDSAYQQILYAYEVLSDPQRRGIYDSLIGDANQPGLKIEIQASRTQLHVSNTEQLLYLFVDVRPALTNDKTHRPLNLALVIDRSTSMQGARLDCVRTAVELIVDKLAPDDIISIVTFSDRAEVIFPAGQIENKNVLLASVRNIRASGGTEIYQGLSAGMKQITKNPLTGHTNHLILLTDGHTYGDANNCLQLAQTAATQGVGFSAFGIGAEWNDQFLDKLVAPSGGQSAFVEYPTQVIEFLDKRISGLGTIYARNIQLFKELPKGIELQYGFKLVPFAQPLPMDGQDIKLGDIEGRVPLSFLLEIKVAAQPTETRLNLPITITANVSSPHTQLRTFKQQIQLLILNEVPPTEPPLALVKAVNALNMYRMNERVWEDVEAGQLHVATTRMRRLSTRLLEAGQTQLAQQAHMEAERLEVMGEMSPEGRKRLKFGTRAILTQMLPAESGSVNHDPV